jgi:hypothetical protein
MTRTGRDRRRGARGDCPHRGNAGHGVSLLHRPGSVRAVDGRPRNIECGARRRISRQDGDGVEAAGEFVEVDPPRRVVFTWGWTHGVAVAPGSTRVVVTLEAENGGTRVVLRHHGLRDDELRAHHRKGWEMYLDRLRGRVHGADPGANPETDPNA